jgi:hypothetical protein
VEDMVEVLAGCEGWFVRCQRSRQSASGMATRPRNPKSRCMKS